MHGCQAYARPVWAEVDLGKITANVKEFCRILPRTVSLMAVVKANAYGHGAPETAVAALRGGAAMLGVASLEEGMELRSRGIEAPILILGYTAPQCAALLMEANLTSTVFSWECARALSEQACARGGRLGCHLKVDTGMGRLGPAGQREALQLLEKVAGLPGLRLEGIFTHLACADERDRTFTLRQLTLFRELLAAAGAKGIHIPLKHAANTAGTIAYPEAVFDLVRVGIGIYGYYPSGEVDRERVYLQPALTLKSRIIYLKKVSAGTPVSYGGSYRAPRDTTIATVALGYGDGLSRRLSNRGVMLVRGQRVPIAGRVCMDMTMLDVGLLNEVQEGDEVVAYGRQGLEEISVDEVAGQLETISYELLCSISARVPRRYHHSGANSHFGV